MHYGGVYCFRKQGRPFPLFSALYLVSLMEFGALRHNARSSRVLCRCGDKCVAGEDKFLEEKDKFSGRDKRKKTEKQYRCPLLTLA